MQKELTQELYMCLQSVYTKEMEYGERRIDFEWVVNAYKKRTSNWQQQLKKNN